MYDAVFFDLDGTIVDGFTAAAHASDRFKRRQAGIGEILGVFEAAMRYRLRRMRFEHLLTRAAGYLQGEALADLVKGSGLRGSLRSQGALPDAQSDVYVADTLGELGIDRCADHPLALGHMHGGTNQLSQDEPSCHQENETAEQGARQ